MEALFAAVNDLPADDPLRNQVNNQQMAPVSAADSSSAAVAEGEQPESSQQFSADTKSTAEATPNRGQILSTSAIPSNPPQSAAATPGATPTGQMSLAKNGNPSTFAGKTTSGSPALTNATGATSPLPATSQPTSRNGLIVVDAQHRIAVPSFLGEPVREAVESAGTLGLSLEILGSGIAREQVPAPGTMVPMGTGIVVRFSR
jgi:cell division protein FtsI (penicillin-binding protein 3)